MNTPSTTRAIKLLTFASLSVVGGVFSAVSADAQAATTTTTSGVTIPWLTNSPTLPGVTDLSLTGKESYDDNVLAVSGLGLPEQSSWVSDITFRIGFDFAPLLNVGPGLSSATFVYQGERADYHNLPSENYTSHRFYDVFKGNAGNFSYSLDNAFLYVDGNKLAETYAANQLSGAAANQGDKYRNNLAHQVARERRNQIQDRYTAQARLNLADNLLFVRPISNLTYYNLDTYLFSTSKAPYLGYQDYIDRWDINGGADIGINVAPNFAFTVGYRDGFQHQDQFALAINSDQHFSANHYQRVLFGFEGQPLKGLTVKFAAGPDFRDFNPDAPIIHDKTTRYYGEASATYTLTKQQSLNFTYKQWIFVSSTGLVPYDDISYALTYHVDVAPRLGLDLGARYLETNYTLGDDFAGSAPSLRDDLEYEGSVGFNYLIAPHFTANVAYVYDKGENGLESLAANLDPAYRDFEHAVVTFGLKYSF